jgi:predicted metal-dependent hydrolase
MKDEIKELLKVEDSPRAKNVRLKYRKGSFTAVKPENAEIDTEKLIEDNLDWFRSHLDKAREYRDQIPERRFEEGAAFSVLGEEKQIVIESRRSNKVEEDILLAEHLVKRTSLKDQLEKSLREHARETINSKLEQYASRIDGDYNKVFIRDQDTRWGSCSSKSNLNFNWRLVLGPEYVLEYVVVHELVHLEISNHGRKFKSRVDKLFPRRVESEAWLEQNNAKLVFESNI